MVYAEGMRDYRKLDSGVIAGVMFSCAAIVSVLMCIAALVSL